MNGISSLPLLSHCLLCSSYHPSLLGVGRFSISTVDVPQRTVRCNLKKRDRAPIDITRRSADYQPSVWDYEFLGSLSTEEFTIDKYGKQRERIITEIKGMINGCTMDPVSRLELVDAIEKLGLKRHFQEEIKRSIEIVYEDTCSYYVEDLYASALRFRLLRQHGYVFSEEDIFNKFKDQSCNFHKVLSKDIRGLLSLYEASFLKWEGDDMLGEVRVSAAQHLKEPMGNLPTNRAKEVQRALELLLHWRFPRLKAR